MAAGWSLVRGVEPGVYEADPSADGYYLVPTGPEDGWISGAPYWQE